MCVCARARARARACVSSCMRACECVSVCVLVLLVMLFESIFTTDTVVQERSGILATYMLCGLSNIGSMGSAAAILSTLVPSRAAEVMRLCPLALLVGNLANFSTACIAGELCVRKRKHGNNPTQAGFHMSTEPHINSQCPVPHYSILTVAPNRKIHAAPLTLFRDILKEVRVSLLCFIC